jgi:hypothetical protein
MSLVPQEEVRAILERVRGRMGEGAPRPRHLRPAEEGSGARLGDGVFASVDDAVAGRGEAFQRFRQGGLEKRYDVIHAVRQAMREHGRELAKRAHEETGLGRADDKVIKNRWSTRRRRGPRTSSRSGDRRPRHDDHRVRAVRGYRFDRADHQSDLDDHQQHDRDSLGGQRGGVQRASQRQAGIGVERPAPASRDRRGRRPAGLVTAIAEPTIESARDLMHHKGVRILLVTGGPAVVQEALKTDKRAITADRQPADRGRRQRRPRARRPRAGARRLVRQQRHLHRREGSLRAVTRSPRPPARDGEVGAYLLREFELRKVERLIFEKLGEPGKPGVLNRAWIGKNAGVILRAAGIDVDPDLAWRSPRCRSSTRWCGRSR